MRGWTKKAPNKPAMSLCFKDVCFLCQCHLHKCGTRDCLSTYNELAGNTYHEINKTAASHVRKHLVPI